MQPLIEEIEPVILVKYEFEYQDKLKTKCFFFRTVKILIRERKTMINQLKSRLK